MAKKLTVDDLKERREKIEDRVQRIRATLESHKIDRDKIFSAENRRRLTPQALREDEQKLKTKTHASLTRWRTDIIDSVNDSFDHRSQWSKETVLRNARFFPAYEGNPVSSEAQTRALMHELLEDVRRNGAERRASRYSAQDLAIEAERAATQGDLATVSVLMQEATNRKLQGEERLAVDLALKKLALPETTEAEAVYSELEGLVDESNALIDLWINPHNEIAAGRESLARFNRRKRAEQIVRETEEEGRRQAEAKAKAAQQASIPMPADDGEPPPQLAA